MGSLKSTFGLSLATLLSRILGFVRDILFARVIGGGLLMSAWSQVQMIPNLLRRIFGEGALGTALVPIIAHTLENDGPEEARRKFSTVLFWMTVLLAVITLVVSGGCLIAEPFVKVERYRLVLLSVPVIMPYCILICLIGVISSCLNTFRIFFWPAMASLIPNILLIGVTAVILPMYINKYQAVLRALSLAVVLSGLLETAVMAILLQRKHIFPKLNLSIIFNSAAIKELWSKFLPGLVGAAAFQIGTLTDSLLALHINDYARSGVYYADRLVYLPIGLFAVAFGTVSLSTLSHYSAEGKIKTVLVESFASMRQLLFIAVPIAAVMISFARELLSLVFEYKAFDGRALDEAYQAMFWLSFGIPSFCLIKLTLNTFYCRKSMKIPAVVSLICIGLNIILSIILMFPMKQGGIMLASVITGTLNNVILFVILKKELGRMPMKPFLKYLVRLVLISAVSAFAARKIFEYLTTLSMAAWLPKNALPLFGAFLFFSAAFLAFSMLCKICTLRQVAAAIRRR